MNITAAVGFFLGLAAILIAGAVARLLTSPSADLMTAVVAAAAVVQAIAASVMVQGLRHAEVQAQAARESVEQLKVSTERQLRAYIDVSTAELIFGEQGDINLHLILKNTGQTPARKAAAAHYFGWVNADAMNAIEHPSAADCAVNRDVAAGGDLMFWTPIDSGKWRQYEDRLKAGEVALVVVGRVEYRDVFDVPRYTLYRRYFRPGTHPTRLATAPEGNQST